MPPKNRRNNGAATRGSSSKATGGRGGTRSSKRKSNVVESENDEGSDEGDEHEERQFGEGEEHRDGDSGEPDPNVNEKRPEIEDADIAGSIFMGVGSAVVLLPHRKAHDAMVKVAKQATDGVPVSKLHVLVHRSGVPPQAVPAADYANLDRAADGAMCPFMQSHLNHEAGLDPKRENRLTEFVALEVAIATQATADGSTALNARFWHTDEMGSYLIIAHVSEVTEGETLTQPELNFINFSVPHPAEAAQVADEASASKEEERLERELARNLSKMREKREAAAKKRQEAIAASKLAAEAARVRGSSSDGSAAGSGGGAANKSTGGADNTQVRSSGNQARNGASAKSPSYGNGHPTLAESKAKMESSYKQHAVGKRAIHAIDVEETDPPTVKHRRTDETKAAAVKKEKEARRPLYPQRLSALFHSGVAVLKCVESELRKARLDMNIPPKKEGRGLQVPQMFGSAMSRIFNLEEAVRSARQWREEREGAGRLL